MKQFILFTFFIFAFAYQGNATHNRAGEITYKSDSLNPLHFYFTLTTYTKITEADRCELTIFFCDFNDSAIFQRVNGPVGTCPQPAKMGESINATIKKNIYIGEHTFKGPVLSCRVMMEDPNRNADIVNIPNSVNEPFFIVSTLSINPYLGVNSSPILLNLPVENACICKKFIHNPGAFDADGDSLSYKLITPFTSFGKIIQGYTKPTGVEINPITGDLTWNCPGPQIGEYNFAIVIEEWRKGQLVGTVERDMQVTVVGGCENNPPVVEAKDTCVVAGTELKMLIKAYDVAYSGIKDSLNNISLIASGGPFVLKNSPAKFQSSNGSPSITSAFNWQTVCEHVRRLPYNVSFIATDDYKLNPLSDNRNISITVIGPAPKLIAANPIGNAIKLEWQTYPCSNAISYKLYRKLGCNNSDFAACQTGIPSSSGYTYLTTITSINTLTYTDSDNGVGLLYGQEYSYRIIALFSDSSESKASNEICAILKRDAPVITHVSIYKTDSSLGMDTIKWEAPSEFDSIKAYPPPYRYLVYRANTIDNKFKLIDSLDGIQSRIYLKDINLNTLDSQYVYRIDFYSVPMHRLVGKSNNASTIRIVAQAGDNAIKLDFNYFVPWINDTFYVYRENLLNASLFDLIGITSNQYYIDGGLINGKTYCYRVLSKGQYSDTTITNPIYNMSQRICAVPVDTTAPCSQQFDSLIVDCDKTQNSIFWKKPICADDIVKFNIYFKDSLNGVMRLYDTLNVNQLKYISLNQDTEYTYIPLPNEYGLAGCYSITAVDSFGNESKFSDTLCVDNCSDYRLPNVFSPNGDNSNDLFNAFPYRFVKDVNMLIYDRWGVLVFETTNPKIAWNGESNKTGKDCSDGVFYYVCTVNEYKLKGITPRIIKGFIMKVSSDNVSRPN